MNEEVRQVSSGSDFLDDGDEDGGELVALVSEWGELFCWDDARVHQ